MSLERSRYLYFCEEPKHVCFTRHERIKKYSGTEISDNTDTIQKLFLFLYICIWKCMIIQWDTIKHKQNSNNELLRAPTWFPYYPSFSALSELSPPLIGVLGWIRYLESRGASVNRRSDKQGADVLVEACIKDIFQMWNCGFLWYDTVQIWT